MLAIGAAHRKIDVVDAMTGARIRQLSGHTGAVRTLAFSCDGTRLASGCKGRSVRYWDAQSGAQLSVQDTQHTKEVTSLQFSPCGRTLCSAGKDGDVVLWWAGDELVLRGVLPDAKFVGNDVMRVQFSADGEAIAAIREYGNVTLWGIESQERLLVIKDNTAPDGIHFSCDSRTFATGRKSRIVLWDVPSGLERRVIAAHKDHVSFLAFNPTKPALLASAGSRDRRAFLSDAVTGVLHATVEHSKWVGALAWSPDGESLACVDVAWTVSVWKVRIPDPEAGLPVRGGPVTLLATLAAGQGTSAHIMSGILCPYVAFSPCGRSIISGGVGGEGLQVWDACDLGAGRGNCRFSLNGSCLAIGRDPEKERAERVAVCMGLHPRLGAASALRSLDGELLRMFLPNVP